MKTLADLTKKTRKEISYVSAPARPHIGYVYDRRAARRFRALGARVEARGRDLTDGRKVLSWRVSVRD